MYLTSKKLYFHSVFNEKSIFFGKETKIIIPVSKVVRIEKQYNAKIFDNSIKVTTAEGVDFFFTSYVYRDQCFDLMMSLIKSSKN